MSDTFGPTAALLAEQPLGEVAAQLLTLTGGNLGEVCFPTPFGNVCVGVNDVGSSIRQGGNDLAGATLGSVIEELVKAYKFAQRGFLPSGPFSTKKVVQVTPAGNEFAALGLVDIGIVINF